MSVSEPGFRIDPAAKMPVFEQVRTQIVAQIDAGTLGAGDRLPTVRELAGTLGVAVNTVAKAFRELETSGIVETRRRHGTFVSADATASAGPLGTAHRSAAEFARTARATGLSLPAAVAMVEHAWDNAAVRDPEGDPESNPGVASRGR